MSISIYSFLKMALLHYKWIFPLQYILYFYIIYIFFVYFVGHSPVFTHRVIANFSNIYFWREKVCHVKTVSLSATENDILFCKSKGTRVEFILQRWISQSKEIYIYLKKKKFIVFCIKKKNLREDNICGFWHTNNCTQVTGVFTTSNMSAQTQMCLTLNCYVHCMCTSGNIHADTVLTPIFCSSISRLFPFIFCQKSLFSTSNLSPFNHNWILIWGQLFIIKVICRNLKY